MTEETQLTDEQRNLQELLEKEPLTLLIAVNRLSGKAHSQTNITDEQDARQLHQVLSDIQRGLGDTIAQMVEARVRNEIRAQQGEKEHDIE